MTALLLLVLGTTPSIHVQVRGGATEVLAFHRGEPVARAAVRDGAADLALDAPEAEEADLVAIGPRCRSELVRRVRPSSGPGFDAVLVAEPCHTLRVETEPGAYVHVGGARFPADAVPLLPGLHRIVVDHGTHVSSAARLVRIDGDRTIAVPLESGLVVHGAVVDADGEPVAGARLDVFADGYPTRRGATSDARGRFAVPGFRGDVISVRARAAGFATRLVRVAFEPGSERARVEVKLEPGADVRLPVDRPVRATLLAAWLDAALEEPRLAANDEAPWCPADREVRFDGLSIGRRYRILLEAPGFLPVATEPFEGAPGLALAPVKLVRGARVHGTLDAPGRLVVCRGAFGERTCRTDRAGRFSFDGLAAGKLIVFVRDVDERGTLLEVAAGADVPVSPSVQAPPEDRRLEGTVLDADRQPLAGVRVTVAGLVADTDDEGAFQVGPLPLGRTRFELQLEPRPGSRGFRPDPHLPRIEQKAQPGIKVRAQLERAGSLDLRFPGSRLARATLLLDGTSGVQQQWRIPRNAARLRIDEIPVGAYVVEVKAPGSGGTGGVVHRAVAGDVEPSEVRLRPGRRASGRVVRRRGLTRPGRPPHLIDTPVENGSVTLFDGAALFALTTTPIGPDGTFVLEGLPAGAVLLCAAVAGHPVAVARVDLTEGDVHDVVMPVFSPMPAGLRLRLPDGHAAPEVRVAVMNEFGFDVRDIAARARFRGVVADDGEFADLDLLFRLHEKDGAVLEHRGLAPGNYEFRVFAAGYKQGAGKVRVRASWTLEHIGSLLPEFSNPVVPVWLVPREVAPEGGAESENPGGD